MQVSRTAENLGRSGGPAGTSLKILLVAPQPFYALRGTPIAVRQVVETLCAAGHQVDLLVYHAGEDIQIPGMRLIRARRPPGVSHVPVGISLQKLACDTWLIARMTSLLRHNRYDVVHAVEEAIFPAVALNAFGHRTRIIYDMDSSLSDQLTDKWRLLKPLRGVFARLERIAVQRSDATLAVCDMLAEKVRPWVGADRVTVLPDVPDCAAAAGAQVESLRLKVSDDLIGLYVGNLEGYQGVELLIEALALMGPQNFRLVVIGGEAHDIARCRARAAALSVEQHAMFLGKRPLEHLPSYLAQADVLLSPRRLGVNTPMKIYSYLQAGKPILATDIRSHTQVLDNTCAYLVPPNASALAGGIRALVEDGGLRARLGAGAAERAARTCSRDLFRRRLLTAYERALPQVPPGVAATAAGASTNP